VPQAPRSDRLRDLLPGHGGPYHGGERGAGARGIDRTVTWTNTDDSPHQITVAGTPLKTGFLLKGENASLTFKDEGVFNYNCALHPNMKGTIQVAK